MPRFSVWWKVAAAGLAGSFALAVLFGGEALGQRRELGKAREAVRLAQDEKDKEKEKDKDKGKDKGKNGGVKKKLEEVYYGVESCANAGCHGGSPPKKWVNDPDTGKPLDLISRCTEADIWKKKDKHADAYNVLTKERGKRMAQILGYDVTKAPQCLACHAVVIKDEAVRKASVAAGFDVKEGVNCVVCHGPHVEWVANHGIVLVASKFRPLSREKKESEYGMRNMWDPVRRTELCSTCHVGSTKEGKFVTHEMYAAGHPPLPGFEVATFSNEMPRHWEYLREKTPALQKELGLRKDEQEQTLLVLVGGVIAFRDTMQLLADQAKAAIATKDEDKKFIDLSNFDCYACHHGLKKDSWRQKPGWYKGRPGRIPMRDWSTELVRLSIDYLASKDKEADGKKLVAELDDGLKELAAAFENQPSGDNTKIEKAASKLAKWADTLGNQINTKYPTTGDVKKMLPEIASKYAKRLVGYDSARQIAWAAEVMNYEANAGKEGSAAVKTALTALDKNLKLRLPVGRDKLIEDELEDNLKKISAYDANDFRKLLEGLGTALKGK